MKALPLGTATVNSPPVPLADFFSATTMTRYRSKIRTQPLFALLLLSLSLFLSLLLTGCGGSTAPLGLPGTASNTAPDIAPVIDYIKASNTGSGGDWFGVSTALSGDGSTLAVGAYREDSNARGINGNGANEANTDSGAVYIFVRSGNTWVQEAYVKASNSDANDGFGTAVSLSNDGHTLAVGAPFEDSAAAGVNALNGEQDNTLPDAGAVYLFTRTAGAWRQKAYVKADNPDQNDQFGASVALSGDGKTLAVGAIGEDSDARGTYAGSGNIVGQNNALDQAGAVYVFSLDAAGDWLQQAYVKASNTGLVNQFGKSVALSPDGSTLLVGAPNESSNGSSEADKSMSGAGAAYEFTRAAGIWSQQAYLKANNPGSTNFFGSTVAISADVQTLAVSAPYEDGDAVGVNGPQTDDRAIRSGAVYVFVRSNAGIWTQQAYVKASNTTPDAAFGSGVALSADGNVMAVSSYAENSNATGLNGNQSNLNAVESGAAYVFTRSSATWRQRAYVKASNTGAGDWFGSGLAMSNDGRTLAIGAPLEDSDATGINGQQASDVAPDAGAVFVLRVPAW